jgi:hypothetical protein
VKLLGLIASVLVTFASAAGGPVTAEMSCCVRVEYFPPLVKRRPEGVGVGGFETERLVTRGGRPGVALSGLVAADLDPTAKPVQQALRHGKYPWYDAEADRLSPVWPTRISWLKWLTARVNSFFDGIGKFFDNIQFGRLPGVGLAGNSIGTVVLLLALLAFFVFIAVLWFRLEGRAARNEAARARLGKAARLGDLPEGIRPGDGDPWAEALKRRAAGDLAGAVVCIFAHQLLTLDQLGLIRLAPGRTGRHYLRAVRDPDFRDALGATLRLFEDVYYGRRLPTTQAFESVWNRACAVQERRGLLGSGALL